MRVDIDTLYSHLVVIRVSVHHVEMLGEGVEPSEQAPTPSDEDETNLLRRRPTDVCCFCCGLIEMIHHR